MVKLLNYEYFAELANPENVALGCSIVNDIWKWDIGLSHLSKVDVGWTTYPPVAQGDCMSISKNATTADVFPCTDAKRIMCTSF